MLRTIAVLALLCASVQAEVKLNFTKEYELVLNKPHFFQSGEEVLVVEYGEEFINTSSSDANAKKCEFKLDKEVHQIDTKMMNQGVQSSILGNGKIVLIGPSNTSESDNFNHYHIYVVHVIDPVACTILSFTRKVTVPKEGLPYMYGNLVSYQDTFDLFFLDSPEPKCCPCRFNDKAEEIEVPFTTDRGSLELNLKCVDSGIKTIKEFDSSEGYLFVCNYNRFKAGMKLLNPKFEVIKEKYSKYPIYDVSIAKGSETYIGVCYKNSTDEPFRKEAICGMLDFDLNPKYTIFLHANEEENISNAKILTLKDGSAWILNNNYPIISHHTTRNGDYARLFVRHVQADGKSSGPVEILKYRIANVMLDHFLFEKEYCVVINAYENFYYEEFPKLLVRGKCFDAATFQFISNQVQNPQQ